MSAVSIFSKVITNPLSRTYALLSVVLLLNLLWLFFPLIPAEKHVSLMPTLRFLDRNGMALREVRSRDGAVAEKISLHHVPKSVQDAVRAAEDKAFYSHYGIDGLATLRALYQNVRALRVVSGASTITQQLGRMRLHCDRTWLSKGLVMAYALRLECHLSKEEIFEDYLNRVYFGNQTYGIAAASQFYFNKRPERLSLAESAMLAGVIRQPSLMNPKKNPRHAHNRMKEILRRMMRLGMIDEQAYHDAISSPITLFESRAPFESPHFIDMMLHQSKVSRQSRPEEPVVQINTSIDLPLQHRVEAILQNHLSRLQKRRVTNGAIVVLNHQNGEILAYVGSADYFNETLSGKYNGAMALRQPGSALKPFIYAMALEAGMTPATLFPDLPLHFELPYGDDARQNSPRQVFFPENFDRKYHGPVRLRQALACSYNIPAVKATEFLGVSRTHHGLVDYGLTSLTKSPEYYGLGLSLGNAEVRLFELAAAYSLFPRQGHRLSPKPILGAIGINGDSIEIRIDEGVLSPKPTQSVISPTAAYLISDILSDNTARRPSFGANSPLHFPFAVGAKTGTTKDFRDNWAVGFSDEFTVAVWVGNFDGTPMQHSSGIDGAAPVMKEIMMTLFERYPHANGFATSRFPKPLSVKYERICALSGMVAHPFCTVQMDELFDRKFLPKERCTFHIQVPLEENRDPSTPSTSPKGFRVVENYPLEYQAWAEDNGKLIQNWRKDHTLHTVKDHAPSRLNIAYPKENMIFAIDPHLKPEFQCLVFRASGQSDQLIGWKINNMWLRSSSSRDAAAAWPLKKGRHLLELHSASISQNGDTLWTLADRLPFQVVE